jgi:hypothetical protein
MGHGRLLEGHAQLEDRQMSRSSTITRRRLFQGAGIAGVAGVAALAPSGVLAKANDVLDDVIVGAWRATLSATGLPPFDALTTFATGGTLVTSASIDLTPQFLSTPGYGAWRRAGDGHYRARFEFFTFDSSSAPSGSGEVKLTISVEGNRQHGPMTLTIFDLTGHVLLTTSGSFDAHRIQVD